ncbi:glycosyltransferase family 4 protein [Candidatus Latescibacterota bacterium]
MKIGLETTWINVPDGGGRYTNEVLRYLCTGYPDHDFFAIGPEPMQNHDYPNLTHITFPDTVGLAARFKYTIRIAPILKKLSVDIYHNLVNFGIYNAPCPVVTTVHDLLTLKYPWLRSRKIHGWLYKYYVPSLIHKADMITVDSENTRKDLKDFYGLEKNVTTVYLGYNKDIFYPENSGDEKIIKRYGLQRGYLLFVGNLIPKKNVEIIIRAYHLLKKKGIHTARLVLAGKRGHGTENILQLIESLSLKDNVIEIGYVPDDCLGALYRQAKMFLFPSKYEGFGLPVLEAMACGTPVLVSGTGPFPEIVGDLRYTCSPDSAPEWAEKILELIEDKTAREDAREWSLKQSQKFSWEKCVEKYMEIYNLLINKA